MRVNIEVKYLSSEHTKNEELFNFLTPLKSHYPKFEEWFKNKCCKERRIAVIARTERGEIVGASILKRKDNKISSFYIAHDFRSEGIGTAMMQKIVKILNVNKKIRIYPLKEHMEIFRRLFQRVGLFYYSKYTHFIDALFEAKVESFTSIHGDIVLYKPYINMKKNLLLYTYNPYSEECENYEVVDTHDIYQRARENMIRLNMTPVIDTTPKTYPDSHVRFGLTQALTQCLETINDGKTNAPLGEDVNKLKEENETRIRDTFKGCKKLFENDITGDNFVDLAEEY